MPTAAATAPTLSSTTGAISASLTPSYSVTGCARSTHGEEASAASVSAGGGAARSRAGLAALDAAASWCSAVKSVSLPVSSLASVPREAGREPGCSSMAAAVPRVAAAPAAPAPAAPCASSVASCSPSDTSSSSSLATGSSMASVALPAMSGAGLRAELAAWRL